MRIWLQLLVPPRVHRPGRGGLPLPHAGDLLGVGVRRLLLPKGRAAHQVQTLGESVPGSTTPQPSDSNKQAGWTSDMKMDTNNWFMKCQCSMDLNKSCVLLNQDLSLLL